MNTINGKTARQWFDVGCDAKTPDEKIDAYSKAIQLAPDYADAYNNRGLAYDDKGQYDEAIEDLNKAIQLKPDYPLAYNNRGKAYHGKGKYDEAFKDYNKAIQLNPDFAEAYNNRGNAYKDKGQYDEAIKDLNKAIQLKPDDALAYYNRGVVYNDKNQYEKAIKDYSKAIELKPDFAGVYFNRANAYDDKGQYDEAIKDYSKAILLKQDLAEAYNNRGLAYGKINKWAEQIADYKKVLSFGVDENGKTKTGRFKSDYERWIKEAEEKLREATESDEIMALKRQLEEANRKLEEEKKKNERERVTINELEGTKKKLRELSHTYVLTIGNAAYKENPLPRSETDAKELAKAFSQYTGYMTKNLTNPTREEILAAVDEFYDTMELPNMKKGIIYVDGHGSISNNGNGKQEQSVSTVHGEKCFVSEFVRPEKELYFKELYYIMECCRSGECQHIAHEELKMPGNRTVAYATQHSTVAISADGSFGEQIINLVKNRDYMSLANTDQLIRRAAKKTPKGMETPQIISTGGDMSGFNPDRESTICF